MNNLFPTALFMTFITLVSYYDLRYKKIYNWLNISFVVCGLILNMYYQGIYGLYLALVGLVVGFCLLLIPYNVGWVGGGDVKFLAAAGVWLGPTMVCYAALYGLIFAGIAAVIIMLAKGRFVNFIKQVFLILSFRGLYRGDGFGKGSGMIPLGFFMCLGSMVMYYHQYLI